MSDKDSFEQPNFADDEFLDSYYVDPQNIQKLREKQRLGFFRRNFRTLQKGSMRFLVMNWLNTMSRR